MISLSLSLSQEKKKMSTGNRNQLRMRMSVFRGKLDEIRRSLWRQFFFKLSLFTALPLFKSDGFCSIPRQFNLIQFNSIQLYFVFNRRYIKDAMFT